MTDCSNIQVANVPKFVGHDSKSNSLGSSFFIFVSPTRDKRWEKFPFCWVISSPLVTGDNLTKELRVLGALRISHLSLN